MSNHCTTCGMFLNDPGEFHPYLFCILKRAGALHLVHVERGASINQLAKRIYDRIGYASHHSAAVAISAGCVGTRYTLLVDAVIEARRRVTDELDAQDAARASWHPQRPAPRSAVLGWDPDDAA